MTSNKHERPLIFLVAGARPNFMKIAPIIRELKKHEEAIDWRLVHTGQHYDREMSDVFFDELEIPKPDYHLEVGSGTHAQQTAKIMTKFEDVCVESHPDLVIVVGDVNSTLACSIVAKKLNIAVAHVEAGLRSGDMTMPEEINRMVTDAISDHFFVTEPSGVENLIREGKRDEEIHFVGHVMIDNLFHQITKLESQDPAGFQTQKIKETHAAYGVVTLHRPSNVDTPETLGSIVSTLGAISTRLPLIFVVHPRTAHSMERFGIELPDSIIPTVSLPYMDFLHLWKDAKLVLTDSGGLQEETTALGIPCVTLRDTTERPVTISEGTNILAGTEPAAILAAVEQALKQSHSKPPPRPRLWDGHAAERIVSIILSRYAAA